LTSVALGTLSELVQEALALMLEKVNEEMAITEIKLKSIAERFGLKDWRELERIFHEEGLDNPEIDLLYPEYLYLKDKLESLKRRKEELLRALSEGRSL